MLACGPPTSTIEGSRGPSTRCARCRRSPWPRARLGAASVMSSCGFTLNDMLVDGFILLEERPGEELVLGTVGRFWRTRGELCATSPARFREPAPAGTAKAAWNFAVGRDSDGVTELRAETRVLCTDVAARRRFRAYWTLIRPFSGLIRREMLAAVRSAAETPPPNHLSATTRRLRLVRRWGCPDCL